MSAWRVIRSGLESWVGELPREASDGEALHLILDGPSPVNALSSAVLRELAEITPALAKEEGVRALLLWSAKEAHFVAGADIEEIAAIDDPESARRLAAEGQKVLDGLARLPYPTFAVIGGTCLGGGLELALACDYRVAVNASSTKIGLPEVQLGIIPGFGGTWRLPRLIGIRSALGLIVAGSRLPAKAAFKKGIVDALVPPEGHREAAMLAARQILKDGGSAVRARRGKRRGGITAWILEKNPLGRSFVARTARKQILKRTRGHYPAPLAAVRAVVNGSRRRLADGLEREAALVGDLIAGDISKNLMAIFGDSEGARHLRVPTDAGGEWPRGGSVGVLGAGVMGAGIAHLLLDRRHFVRLRDLSAEALQKGLEHIGSLLDKQVKRRRKTPLQRDEITSRLTHTTGVEGFGRTDALIEAIVEILAVKRKALAEIEPHIGPETLFLSNTSALSITALQEGARHPERVVGLHFFNPVHRMPLVEVIPGEGTASWAVAKTVALAQALGKLPVVVKDSPGFLVNRLLLPYLGAACRLLEEGIPGPVIDRAALDFGLPMGPLRLLDEVGIDIAAEVGGTLHQAFGDRARPSPLLQRMADKEWLGQKSGIGFYRHEGQASGSATLPWNEGVETGSSPGGGRLPGDAEIVFALLDPMIDEAARCLEEGVVTGAGQVDLAMVMGTGFPAFRGGLLRHADRIGLGGIVERLERHARDGRGAAPCELLRRLARDGARFHGTTKNPAATESPERHPSRV